MMPMTMLAISASIGDSGGDVLNVGRAGTHDDVAAGPEGARPAERAPNPREPLALATYPKFVTVSVPVESWPLTTRSSTAENVPFVGASVALWPNSPKVTSLPTL